MYSFSECVLYFVDLHSTSLRRVSIDLGHSASYIGRVLNGVINPPLSLLIEICEYFRITPAQFWAPYHSDPVSIQHIIQELITFSNEH